MIDKNRPRRNVFRVERKSVRRTPEQFKNLGNVLRGGGGIKTHQANRAPRTENSDHDRFVIDRIHEHVTSVALMIESIEFYFADAAREITSKLCRRFFRLFKTYSM